MFGTIKAQTVKIDTIIDYSNYRKYIANAEWILTRVGNNDYDNIVEEYSKSKSGLLSKQELEDSFSWLRSVINKSPEIVKSFSSVVTIVTYIPTLERSERSVSITYKFPSEYDGLYNEVIISFIEENGRNNGIEYRFNKAKTQKKIFDEIERVSTPK